MTNHCATYWINYTARVNGGGRRSSVAVRRVRTIKPISYRALIISATPELVIRARILEDLRLLLDRLKKQLIEISLLLHPGSLGRVPIGARPCNYASPYYAPLISPGVVKRKCMREKRNVSPSCIASLTFQEDFANNCSRHKTYVRQSSLIQQ